MMTSRGISPSAGNNEKVGPVAHPDETEVTAEEDVEKNLTTVALDGDEQSPVTKVKRSQSRMTVVTTLLLISLVLVVVSPLVLMGKEDNHSTAREEANASTGDGEEVDSMKATEPRKLARMDGDNGQTTDFTPSQRMWNCSEKVEVALTCEQAVMDISALHNALEYPEHFHNRNPVLQEGDFDVARYFDVLQHLSLADGQVLEYVYRSNFHGGHPVLYVRDKETEEPFLTAQEYSEKACTDNYTCPNGSFLNDVLTDDTPQGYMQLASLDVMGSQFYLFWHSKYNDHQLVCNVDMMEKIFREFGSENAVFGCLECLSEKELDLARSLDWAPTVECGELEDGQKVVQVRVMAFTKWGGFYRRTYTIAREGSVSDERILDADLDIVIPYQISLMY